MFVRIQNGELINLEKVATIFIDKKPDGSVSVEAMVPIEMARWHVRFSTLATFASAPEAQSYIDDLANLIGAVTPRANSELATTEAKQ